MDGGGSRPGAHRSRVAGGRAAGTAILTAGFLLAASYIAFEITAPVRAPGRTAAPAAAAPMIPHPSVRSEEGEPVEPVQLLWEFPLPSVIGLALAPDGSALAVLSLVEAGESGRERGGGGAGAPRARRSVSSGTENGAAPVLGTAGNVLLRVYSRDQTLRWQRRVEGCSRVVVGRGGELIATYEPRSALQRTLCLWSGDGHLEGAWRFEEALTSVALADDGRRAVVGTEAGEVRLLLREGATWRRLPALQAHRPVHAVAFGPDDAVWVLAGDPPTLAGLAPGGATLFQEPLWRGAVQSLSFSASAEGHFAAVAAELQEARPPMPGSGGGVSPPPGAAPPSPSLTGGAGLRTVEVQFWSARGRRLWRSVLEGRAPHVRLAAAGDGVILAYGRGLSRRERGRLSVERALAAFDRTGTERWRKGGAFFSPLLVAVEPRGEWVLSLGPQSKFWLLGRRGETRWRSISYPPVQIAVGSLDGRTAAAYRLDGRLMMLAIES